jgi:hypothetical protein
VLDSDSGWLRYVQLVDSVYLLIFFADTILQAHMLIKKSCQMNYTNYEAKIVERFGVALQSWPIAVVCNPSQVNSCLDLNKLVDALDLGTCMWIKLTDDELKARKTENRARSERGEPVYKPRKRKEMANKRPPVVVSSDDLSSGDESDQ